MYNILVSIVVPDSKYESLRTRLGHKRVMGEHPVGVVARLHIRGEQAAVSRGWSAWHRSVGRRRRGGARRVVSGLNVEVSRVGG